MAPSKQFTYSPRKHDLSTAYLRIMYNDSSTKEMFTDGGETTKGLPRTDLKSVTVVSKDEEPLYTLPIVNNKLIIRKKVLATGLMKTNPEFTFSTPKKGYLLATDGKIAYFWDSGEIKEFKTWQKVEPYTMPELFEVEK